MTQYNSPHALYGLLYHVTNVDDTCLPIHDFSLLMLTNLLSTFQSGGKNLICCVSSLAVSSNNVHSFSCRIALMTSSKHFHLLFCILCDFSVYYISFLPLSLLLLYQGKLIDDISSSNRKGKIHYYFLPLV